MPATAKGSVKELHTCPRGKQFQRLVEQDGDMAIRSGGRYGIIGGRRH